MVWLRICVAFGVLSGRPAPTGDRLAPLHGFVCDLLSGNPATCTALPNRAWLPGGGLIGGLAFRPALHGFHLPGLCRTLRIRPGRRLPPARERLAKHSGDGSGAIVGMGWEGGDEWRWIFLEGLCSLQGTACRVRPPLPCRASPPQVGRSQVAWAFPPHERCAVRKRSLLLISGHPCLGD